MKSLLTRQTKTRAETMAEEIDRRYPLPPNVKTAIGKVPREKFVPGGFALSAYKLDALPMHGEQWISSPLTVAKMTAALQPERGMDNVLEIGTGSGYQAAVLSHLFRRVFSVERIEKLLTQAKQRFKEERLVNVNTKLDDGNHGWKQYAPYDRILFSACAETIPPALFDQLRPDGMLVAPMKKGNRQIITRFTLSGGRVVSEELDDCQFVPVLSGVVKK